MNVNDTKTSPRGSSRASSVSGSAVSATVTTQDANGERRSSVRTPSTSSLASRASHNIISEGQTKKAARMSRRSSLQPAAGGALWAQMAATRSGSGSFEGDSDGEGTMSIAETLLAGQRQAMDIQASIPVHMPTLSFRTPPPPPMAAYLLAAQLLQSPRAHPIIVQACARVSTRERGLQHGRKLPTLDNCSS